MNKIKPLSVLPSWIIPQTPQEKTANDIFWVFFLNKGKSPESLYANSKHLEFLTNRINQLTESLWEAIKDEKENIEINKLTKEYLHIIEKYLEWLWIKTPNNLLDKIEIVLFKWNAEFVISTYFDKLYINYEKTKDIPKKQLWEAIIILLQNQGYTFISEHR